LQLVLTCLRAVVTRSRTPSASATTRYTLDMLCWKRMDSLRQLDIIIPL
jgi:hypothetical protein